MKYLKVTETGKLYSLYYAVQEVRLFEYETILEHFLEIVDYSDSGGIDYETTISYTNGHLCIEHQQFQIEEISEKEFKAKYQKVIGLFDKVMNGSKEPRQRL